MVRRYGLLSLVILLFLLMSCATFSTGNEGLEATVAALESQVAGLSTRSAHDGVVISYLATRVGAVAQTPLPADARPTPYRPLQGEVLIEEDRCCVGGIAGDTVEIEAAFAASNPESGAAVIEMRVRTGMGLMQENDLEEAEWEAFVQEKVFSYTLPLNWTGFYVCVQYRDADGLLSEVVCDDISVEGHAPSPTP